MRVKTYWEVERKHPMGWMRVAVKTSKKAARAAGAPWRAGGHILRLLKVTVEEHPWTTN